MALRTGKHRAGTPPRQTLQHARWTGARWDTAILLCTVTPWERETLRGTHCMLRGRQAGISSNHADFEGGALSSDFGALLLCSVDRQMGLTERLATAIHDKRHQSYLDHPLRDLLAQRISQIASMRLVLACAAYALHHALCTQTLPHTALAQAQPSTIMLTL